MATSLWQKVTGPSAGLVQQHYTAARVDDLKRRNPALEQQLAKVLSEHPALAHLKLKGDKYLDVYSKINRSLQAADMTINFKAESWFATENNYDSYTQMYERSGKTLLSDALNPADVRARVDDAVTFPAAWTAGAPTAQRGLRPGQQSGARIQNQMAFGQQTRVTQKVPGNPMFGDGEVDQLIGVQSANPHFNPKTKQIFAALNYGRRPHGSSLQYGNCHLVLHPKLKVNAMYYGSDTFFLNKQETSAQMPYQMLAGVLAYAKPNMVSAIIQSCLQGASLTDLTTSTIGSEALLLEGHIFGALPFKGNLAAVCMAVNHKGTDIGKNAVKFAAKHGAKLVWVA